MILYCCSLGRSEIDVVVCTNLVNKTVILVGVLVSVVIFSAALLLFFVVRFWEPLKQKSMKVFRGLLESQQASAGSHPMGAPYKLLIDDDNEEDVAT